jgi:hypothetical protein
LINGLLDFCSVWLSITRVMLGWGTQHIDPWVGGLLQVIVSCDNWTPGLHQRNMDQISLIRKLGWTWCHKWHNVHPTGGIYVKSLDAAIGCQNVTGNKCHSGPYVQWTFHESQNVTRTFRGSTFRQGTCEPSKTDYQGESCKTHEKLSGLSPLRSDCLGTVRQEAGPCERQIKVSILS